MTTTTVDTQVLAATTSGGRSTPVKLTLQGGTMAVAAQLSVAITRAASPSTTIPNKKCFTLCWAFSPDDITLANVPDELRLCTKTQVLVIDPGAPNAPTRTPRIQVRDKVNGQYCYFWFEYPTSEDAYTVNVKATETFFLNDPLNPTFTSVLVGDGSAAAPAISFASATGLGFYKIAATELGLASAGVRIGDFYTASSGLGIQGGSNGNGASMTLSHQGAITLTAGTNTANQSITLTPSGNGLVLASLTGTGALALSRGSTNFYLAPTSSGDESLQFITNGGTTIATFKTTPRFLFGTTVDSSALLQIGTNTTTSEGGMVFGTDNFWFRVSATETAHVGASGVVQHFLSSSSLMGMFTGAGGTGSGIFFNTSNAAIIQTNGTTAFTLDSSQNATFAGRIIQTNAVTPASAAATGTVGTMAWDTSYIYICTASNTWKRAAIATW